MRQNDMVHFMRKMLWILILLGGYIWLSTSGKSDLVLEQGKILYQTLITWLEDAEVDFQLKAEKGKKRSRRWE